MYRDITREISAAKLQRKWKSLRDSYNRERNKLKNIKSGSEASGRKECIYFQQHSFLSVLTETRPESQDGEQEPDNKSSSVQPSTPVDRKGYVITVAYHYQGLSHSKQITIPHVPLLW